MTPPYLFLDFDGVLHPGLAGTLIRLPLLAQFLRDHPQVNVVLSTSWRQDHPLAELRAYFSAELRNRVIDCTPVLPDGTRWQRYAEIGDWLRGLQMPILGPHWAALDDDASFFPPFCDQLVLCDPARGLRPPQIDELRRKLALT